MKQQRRISLSVLVCLAIVSLNVAMWTASIDFLLKVFSFAFSTMILIMVGLFWKSQVDGENKYARK